MVAVDGGRWTVGLKYVKQVAWAIGRWVIGD